MPRWVRVVSAVFCRAGTKSVEEEEDKVEERVKLAGRAA